MSRKGALYLLERKRLFLRRGAPHLGRFAKQIACRATVTERICGNGSAELLGPDPKCLNVVKEWLFDQLSPRKKVQLHVELALSHLMAGHCWDFT